MTPQILEQMFGKDSSKVFEYLDLVPEVNDPFEFITLKFAQVVGNNQIDCIVTNIQKRWLIYTKFDIEIDDQQFRLLAILPYRPLNTTLVEDSNTGGIENNDNQV